MKTQIFKDYFEFSKREDKTVNGVSEYFAKIHPDFEKENIKNNGCWNCSGCSGCSRCSGCYGCSGCSDCSRCSDCSGCSGCSGCSRCSRCSGCSDCSDCSGCYGCSDCSGCSRCSDCSGLEKASPISTTENNPDAGFVVPKIENIHSKIFEVVSHPNALNMSDWHTCDTTHCRAGWVVQLAGESGKALEKKTSTVFAAIQIYHASNPEIPVSPTQFYKSNTEAMEDMKRCAEAEQKIK